MKLAISYIALRLLVCFGVALSASVENVDHSIAKRDVDVIPAIIGGAVDMTLGVLDRFGKGFAIRGSSKTGMCFPIQCSVYEILRMPIFRCVWPS